MVDLLSQLQAALPVLGRCANQRPESITELFFKQMENGICLLYDIQEVNIRFILRKEINCKTINYTNPKNKLITKRYFRFCRWDC